MKKLILVIFSVLIFWACESQKEDKVRLAVLKSVYDDKWGICNRAVYTQEKAVREMGGKVADTIIWKESQYYRDSTLQYLEKGKIEAASAFVRKGLVDKKLNADKLINQIHQLDSTYASHKDSTSLLYVQISIVSGLSRILNDNSAKLGAGF